ncbi:MAG: glycosyltransferase [Eubacterium sp.]|nr:glycosyltransferase [Eubacterium sp.]
MKKALIVTRVSGFVPQFEMNNVKILQELGFEVHYAANFDTIVYGTDNSRLEGTDVVCHHIAFCRSPFSPSVRCSYRELKQLLLAETFDLIHCHMPMTGVVARMAAQSVRRITKREVPVLYTAHGFHFFRGAPLKNWIYYAPERWLARYTDRLITINEEDYRRALSFPVRGKAEKIPGVGIELEDVFENQERRQIERWNKRAELGVSDQEYLLISVGELNKNKNHIAALMALKECQDPSLRYVLCGEGTQESILKEYVEKNGLAAQVIFAGYRSDINRLLDAADLFVFPSLREGLSIALMEAMRAGLPVIAKKIRGNVDLIEDGKGGVLLEKGTVSEYAGAIRALRENRPLARSMGEWNQERIQEFTTDKTEVKMRRIYESVIEEDR